MPIFQTIVILFLIGISRAVMAEKGSSTVPTHVILILANLLVIFNGILTVLNIE